MAIRPILPAAAIASPAGSGGRIASLDGLRGVAAFVVVVFHFLCLLHPSVVPAMTDDPVWIADTPLGILWNGPFAVSVFFVLSGFVMAAAADRRRNHILSNLVTRYLRLALPVLASVLFAWMLLSLFPHATESLRQAVDDPSPWLMHTYQGTIPPLYIAVADGLVANFVRGGSSFNNVLWTMQVELIGSAGLFLLYWLVSGPARIALLAVSGAVIMAAFRDAYLGFVLGALLYEAHTRGMLRLAPTLLPPLALLLGVLLGAPGQGTAERWGISDIPNQWLIGQPTGVVPILAAALILYAALTLAPLAALFRRTPPQWLGRISFALYLVHVPLLYTLVAFSYVRFGLDPLVLGALYIGATLVLAHAFTVWIDEPTLRLLGRLRAVPARARMTP